MLKRNAVRSVWRSQPGFGPRLLLGLGVVGLTLSTLPGCSKKSAPSTTEVTPKPATGIAISFQPTEEQRKAAAALTKQIDQSNRFPRAEARNKQNAKLFLYLAATSKEPAVIQAALDGMYSTYAAYKSKRKVRVDEDFSKVVVAHLGSKNDKILARALHAAKAGIAGRSGDKPILTKILEVGRQRKDGPAQFAVLDALRRGDRNLMAPEVSELMLNSLKHEKAYVVSMALQALTLRAGRIKDRKTLKAKAIELAKHADPGVRGRALGLLSRVGHRDEAALQVALEALKDEHPFVRSEAADALVTLRYQPAIHELIKLVDDMAENRYDIEGWKHLDGTPGRLHHDGSAWSRVNDSVMSAIKRLSRAGRTRLKLDPINAKSVEESLKKNAAATKAWYAKEKAVLPKPGDPPVVRTPPRTAAGAARKSPVTAGIDRTSAR